LCIGLSGMAVGLGALMPNFSDPSPSKIAAGFGGTLNLVLSALYILVVVLLTALPCHFYLLENSSERSSEFLDRGYLTLLLGAGIGVSLAMAVIVSMVPMRLGLKAFRELEV
jgi:ABC-2 type transport system permease protein